MVTAVVGAILGCLVVVLGFRVSLARMQRFEADATRVRVRVHANLIENAPMFVLGLLVAELCGGSKTVLTGIGTVFVVARVSHAIGLSGSWGPSVPRFIGTAVTWSSIGGVWLYGAGLAIGS